MNYRIRFRRPDGTSEGEVVIDAHSPTEAMVKFRVSSDGPGRFPQPEREVTSVQADEPALG